MDLQFTSKLQKLLTEVGTKNGLAPPQSQDPADAILHEYFVAETGRSLFDKRRKKALERVKALDDKHKLFKLLTDAERHDIVGTTSIVDAANYSASVTLKTPTRSLDQTALYVELIKQGVNKQILDDAIAKCTSKNKAAETWTVSVKTT